MIDDGKLRKLGENIRAIAVRFAVVDDYRKLKLARKGAMLAKCLLLNIARDIIPIIIKPRLADGDDVLSL